MDPPNRASDARPPRVLGAARVLQHRPSLAQRSLLVALLFSSAAQAARQNVLEYVHGGLARDRALDARSRQQYATGRPVRAGELRDGDLVFFDTSGSGVLHVGLVVDAGRRSFIHASVSHGVVEASLDDAYFKSRFLGARRVAR